MPQTGTRRWAKVAAIAVVLLPLDAASGWAQNAGVSLPPPVVPKALLPNAPASIEARPQGAAVCRLTLTPVRGTGPSTVELGSAEAIVWRWLVPAAPGRGTARGTVRCWEDQADVGAFPDAMRAFEIEVRGRGALRNVVARRSLSAALRADRSELLDDLANAAQTIGAVVGVITLLFIAKTLRVTRQEARAERTTQLFERYNNRDFMRAWSQVLGFLSVENEAQCVDRIRRIEAVPTGNDRLLTAALDLPAQSPAERATRAATRVRRTDVDEATSLNDVKAFVHFFEEAALLFNERTVEPSLMARSFGPAIVLAFSQCWWWICYSRGGSIVAARLKESRDHETETYAELERAVGVLVSWRPELEGDRPGGQEANVRALCLPDRLGDDATPQEWRQCERLSLAVGQVLRRSDGFTALSSLLAALPGAVADPVRSEAVGRTLCLPPWGEMARRPGRRAHLKCQLGAWLDARRRRRGLDWLRRRGLEMTRADSRVCAREDYQRLAWRLDRCRRGLDAAGVDALIAKLESAACPPVNSAPSRAASS